MANNFPDKLSEIGRNCFCLQSRMTARVLTRQYNAALAPHDLEITEFSLLVAIKQGVDSSMTELAERMAFERSTLVRSLKRITERGLVENSSTKGRAVKYVLTKKGDEVLNEAMPSWLAVQASVRENLSEEIEPVAVLQSLRHLRNAGR
ncbi:MAG TPA: MarR family winged helix-turn-helix transcriptional regulator [Drouetiella sp.]